MPEPRTVNLEVLPAGKDELFYLDRFMAEFGAGRGESVALTTPFPEKRMVSKDVFTNHQKKGGALKVTKEGRELYAIYIAEAIKNPDEAWIDSGGHGDKTMLCLARYAMSNRKILHIIATFKEKQAEIWVGWSGYNSDSATYYGSKRKGNRIYVRPET